MSIEQYGEGSDPCQASGLVCLFVGNDGLCLTPSITAQIGSPDGPPFDQTACSAKDNKCASYYTGADRAAPVCGPFMIGAPDHCEEACTTGDDCDSITSDCLNGQCKPNYCFADNAAQAKSFSSLQMKYGGIAVSSNADVLLQPCGMTSGSFPTACLPQYDSLANGTTGECIRVGGDGSGSWGDPCDPNPYRNNLNGLCQAGTYCNLGTCMPWCDLGNVSCPAGPPNPVDGGTVPLDCQALPSGPLVSSTLGATHSLGVCAQTCDPYVDDSQNGCEAFQFDAGPKPFLGCKFSGKRQRHLTPSLATASPFGRQADRGRRYPCTSFGWIDPCVSGAQCIQVVDAGVAFVCRQLCDPSLSPNITIPAPACPSDQTCVPISCPETGGSCSHTGSCQ